MSVPVPAGTRGRDCDVRISRTALHIGVRGSEGGAVLSGTLHAAVAPAECTWSVDGRTLEVVLQKAEGMAWWTCVVEGEPCVDTKAVEPENSQLGDLDPDMRATVEKMMYDQRQKAMGKPTSDEQARSDTLARFMAQHPEMDFSNAKIG